MQRRAGFTLVEMLVAMALTIFIMTILSQAFVTGLETFRLLKGLGDMQANLRVASLRLRGDLAASHFEADRKLSDVNFWGDGKPQMGFFFVNAPGATSEGQDGDGLPSFQAANHTLHFSVRLRGNHREGFLQASVPAGSALLTANTTLGNQPTDARVQDQANVYTSAWGEVAYFLAKQGTTVEPNSPAATQGTPLYRLFRAQKVVVGNAATVAGQATDFPEMSGTQNGGNVQFFSPVDLAKGSKGISSYTPGSGASSLLDNVVSFQVQLLCRQDGQTAVFWQNPTNAVTFDTTAAPPGYTVVALQITVRVWDGATQQARQVSIFQDL